MNDEKRKVGRPRFEVTEEVLQEVEEMAGRGLTVKQIATCLGISPATIYNKQVENLEFLDTIKKGKAIGIQKVTNALFENATVNKDNVAIIYYLNNRDKDNWSNKQEVTTTIEQRHIIDLTRIPDDQLESIENAFSRLDTGASEGGEVSEIIEGVYEG
jgi:predicted transcriptional regulator